jgi:hypothetical protein
VLQAVQFPASISDLDTGLTNVNRDNFTHSEKEKKERETKKERGEEEKERERRTSLRT